MSTAQDPAPRGDLPDSAAPPADGPVSSAQPAPAPPDHPIRLRHDGPVTVIGIPEEGDFAALRTWLRERLAEEASALGGRAARLDLGTRPIQLFDVRRLVNLLREEFHVEVTGLIVAPDAVWSYAERELKLKLFPREEAPLLDLDGDAPPDDAGRDGSAPGDDGPDEDGGDEEIAEATLVPPPRLDGPPDVDPLDELLGRADTGPGTRAMRINRTLRSGAHIRFDGDILVFGDVNPGAELIATGNIVVMGALKGLAHAGATGDESAIIWGLDLRPTQLRIARKIAIAPALDGPAGTFDPTVARIDDGHIVLEPYRTRSLR